MATSRLYFNNYLTQSTFSAFAVAGSAVANEVMDNAAVYTYAAGHVGFATRGTYTADAEKDYVVEATTGGTFAAAKWRWSDTGGQITAGNPTGWNVSNLTPVSGVWVLLNNGLEVQFTDTTGTLGTPQFVLGDYAYARMLRPHGIAKALDGSRNTEYRSGALPTSSTLQIGWDLGTARQPTFLGGKDLNLPSNATLSLRAHATTLFSGSPSHNQAVTWRANGDVSEFITSSAYRYWWLNLVMGGTALSYLRISELFLGTGVTFLLPSRIGFTMHHGSSWPVSIDS